MCQYSAKKNHGAGGHKSEAPDASTTKNTLGAVEIAIDAGISEAGVIFKEEITIEPEKIFRTKVSLYILWDERLPNSHLSLPSEFANTVVD